MESHQAEEFLGQSMEGARRLVLFSLYYQLSPIVLEEDSALVKTLLFRESVERYKHEKAPLYNPARSLKHQLKQLNEAGYPAAEKFKVHAGDISTLSGKVASLPSCDAYNIPYILVIPFSIVPMKTQLAAIHAQNFLKQEDFTTFLNMPTPLRPYLISDVSAGEMYKGRSVSEALPLLEAGNRLPLSLEETIALLTQTRG